MAIARLLAPMLIAACAACQTTNVPDIKPEDVYTRDAVRQMFRPILASRQDVLTVGTLGQIVDHNNVYWCQFPEEQPEGFDAAICFSPKRDPEMYR